MCVFLRQGWGNTPILLLPPKQCGSSVVSKNKQWISQLHCVAMHSQPMMAIILRTIPTQHMNKARLLARNQPTKRSGELFTFHCSAFALKKRKQPPPIAVNDTPKTVTSTMMCIFFLYFYIFYQYMLFFPLVNMLFSPAIFSCLIKKGRAIRPLPIYSSTATTITAAAPIPIPIKIVAIAMETQCTTAISWSPSAKRLLLRRFSNINNPSSNGRAANPNKIIIAFIRYLFLIVVTLLFFTILSIGFSCHPLLVFSCGTYTVTLHNIVFFS